ncbi:hypothetical protein D0Y65_041000 [Glycine soja]|uniref:Uncharacterized protein n=1 Tax=Glycine soja TaxID=3848 RepID=A0A445GTY5_GLYSO|nr:hypothetical protein D0Y65_041000 [Glycine soja]
MGQAFRRASGRIRAASEADTSSFSKSKTAVDRQPPPNAAADKAAQIPKAAEQDVLHTGMSFSLCRFKVANEFYPEIVFYYVVVFVNVTLRFKVLVLEIFLHLQCNSGNSLFAYARDKAAYNDPPPTSPLYLCILRSLRALGVNTDNILEERDPKFDAMLGQMVGRITSKPGGKPEMGEAFVVEKFNRPMPKLRNTKPDFGRNEERPVPAGTLNVAQLRHIILLHEGKADDYNGRMDAHQIAEKFRVNVVQIQTILQFLSLPPENSSKDKNKAPR